MGAMMGTGVGLTIGFIFGSYSILRYVYSVTATARTNIGFTLFFLGRAQAQEVQWVHFPNTC